MTYYTQLQLLASMLRLAKDEEKAKEVKDFAEKYLEFVVGTLSYKDCAQEIQDKMDELHSTFANVGL